MALAIGAVWGRRIERALPSLVPYLPLGGILLFILGSVYALKLGPNRRRLPPFSLELLKSLALTLCIPAAMLCLCEQLIVAPIERVHFFKYSTLACFSFFSERRPHAQRFLLAFVFASVVGCAEELAQQFIPDRYYDPRDMLLNACGSFFGACYASLLLLWKPMLEPAIENQKRDVREPSIKTELV